MIIYYFGNSSLSCDSSAIKVCQILKKMFPFIDFRHADPTDEWLESAQKNVVIIDTVAGLNHATTYCDMKDFIRTKSTTVHDYDLSIELPLLIKTGKIQSILIIAIPEKGNSKEFANQAASLIRTNVLLKSETHNSCKDHTPE